MKGPIIFIIIFLAAFFIFLIGNKLFQLKQFGFLTRKGVFEFIDGIIITLSIVVILVTISYEFNFIRYKLPIEHKNWNSIELKDFRGLKKPNMTMDGEAKFAFVSTEIRIKRNRNYIEIKTLFHPCRSYVYNEKLFANDLLKHEMYHFHIAEYCARLLRKEIKSQIGSGKPYNLRKTENKVLIQERELQYQYDDDTYHSYILGKQIKWQNKIDSLLISLDEYSNTIISLKN